MKSQPLNPQIKYTLEEIRLLEEQCRKMRSEAIFDTCAALFSAIRSFFSSPAPKPMDTRGQSSERPLGVSAH